MASEGRVTIRAGGSMVQCQARHGQHKMLRCIEKHPEGTEYDGHRHWAIRFDGKILYWDDLVAMWPVFGDETASPRQARDTQVGGDHYSKHKIQHWDIVQEYGLNYFEGAIVKYVLRHRDKNGVEDLKKARHTLDKLIEIEESQ